MANLLDLLNATNEASTTTSSAKKEPSIKLDQSTTTPSSSSYTLIKPKDHHQHQPIQSRPPNIASITPPTSDSDLSNSTSSNSSLPPSPPKYIHSQQQQTQNNQSQPVPEKPIIMLRDHIPKPKINRFLLGQKIFVKLAIRRKYSSRKKALGEYIAPSNHNNHHSNNPYDSTKQSKLHIKSLKAGIKIKLTVASNLFNLYLGLIPFTDDRKIYTLFNDQGSITQYQDLLNMNQIQNDTTTNSSNTSRNMMVSKGLQLINNNVVDLSEYSNKIIKSFTSESHLIPTFNSLDTAIQSLFGVKQFTLIRITRSTTDDIHGSCILKLETAKPGDYNLIDDEENSDEMLHSLGKTGEVPNNLFFKKIIARPRYKSNMKIYFIPQDLNYSLYTDYRMFERDLFNGIIQLEFNNLNDLNDLSIKRMENYDRNVYCTFQVESVLKNYKLMLIETMENPQLDKETVKQQQPQLQKESPSQQSQQSQVQAQQPGFSNARSRSVDDVLMNNGHNNNRYTPQLPVIQTPQQQHQQQIPMYPYPMPPPLPMHSHLFPIPQSHHHHQQQQQQHHHHPMMQQQHQQLQPIHYPPPPPPHQQQQQQFPQQFPHLQSAGSGSGLAGSLPSFVHLPPPLPSMFVQQQQNNPIVPRSSMLKNHEGLNLLRPIMDYQERSIPKFDELIQKEQR